jgi:hypothetical protein
VNGAASGEAECVLFDLEPDSPAKIARDAQHLAAFEEWWKIYPRTRGVPKKPARISFLRAVKAGVDSQRMITAAGSFAAAVRAKGTAEKHMPYPASWLNQERWDDEPEETPRELAARLGRQAGERARLAATNGNGVHR